MDDYQHILEEHFSGIDPALHAPLIADYEDYVASAKCLAVWSFKRWLFERIEGYGEVAVLNYEHEAQRWRARAERAEAALLELGQAVSVIDVIAAGYEYYAKPQRGFKTAYRRFRRAMRKASKVLELTG